MNREKLLNMLKEDIQNSSINKKSKEMGIPFSTLHRILHGNGGGNVKTWDRIEKYYSVQF
jgi:predicted transcriptional regulator